MRDILFRGKDIETNQWVYGGVYELNKKAYIVTEASMFSLREVIPTSVGQYTCFKDKKGVKIFEGDVLRRITKEPYKPDLLKVVFRRGMYAVRYHDRYEDFKTLLHYGAEIVGNVTDGKFYL